MKHGGLAIALVLVWGLGGCAALWVGAAAGAAAGVGTVAYVRGELQTVEEMDLDTAWGASLAAVEELEFDVKQRRKDALAGRITAERADGRDVQIRLDDRGEGLTGVGIRVGVFGDEAVSRLILDRIRAHAVGPDPEG